MDTSSLFQMVEFLVAAGILVRELGAFASSLAGTLQQLRTLRYSF